MKLAKVLLVLFVVGFVVWVFYIELRRPYNYDHLEVLEPYETGFLVQLEGDSQQQAMFKSVEFLRKSQVMTRRIRIRKRWNQTGHMSFTGEYILTHRLIKVDRSPVTRWWTRGVNSGTSKKDQAIRCESMDSIGFGVGFVITANIMEGDEALYLYRYRSKSLADVMDNEIRAEVQKYADQIARKYILDTMREQKIEIINNVAEKVVPFFKERGITITTLGMVDGFEYENEKVQKSIDNAFIQQQREVINTARNEAQDWKNMTIDLQAQQKAFMEKTLASGEADALRIIAEATKEAQQVPLFYMLQVLDVEKARIEKWNGKYPKRLMELGSMVGQQNSPVLLINPE